MCHITTLLLLNYPEASTGAINHCDANVWWFDAKSYKLVHVLMAHISHLQRTSEVVITHYIILLIE